MKILYLVLALFSTHVYGQDFDLNDLLGINSEHKFKQFCFENGFSFEEKKRENLLNREQYTLIYKFKGKNYSSLLDQEFPGNTQGGIQAQYSNYSEKHWSLKLDKGTFSFYSDKTFEKLVKQAKSNCIFTGFRFVGLEEYACYKCPNSKFRGELGFFRGTSNYVVLQVTPHWVKLNITDLKR
jgi:hypothetical protein